MAVASAEFDEQMIRRAIDLAMGARGRVEPNPMVGCVIVKNGNVIGQGRHDQFGGPHAEPNALADCKESPAGATAYVTLEPCCHTNKKTPPCVPALIAARIARVVVGCADPNPEVNGKGLDELRSAGVKTDVNVCEDSAKQLLAPFIAQTVYDRPYVTLKWAQTADGKIAGAKGKPLQISGPLAAHAIHALRSRCDAILVGINTVLADDPLLTARDIATARPLVRIVLDSQLRIPLQSRLVRTAREHHVIVEFDRTCMPAAQNKFRALQDAGVQPFTVDRRFDGLNLHQVLEPLSHFGIAHVLVEPGPTLAKTFFEQNLSDRVWLIRSPRRLDESEAVSAAAIPAQYVETGEIDLEGDRLSELLNPASPVFFAREQSADFRLAEKG